MDARLSAALARRNAAELLAELLRSLPGASLEEDEPPRMVLSVPTGCAALGEIFERLAAARARHGVLECSLSQTTLEQIFLLMARDSAASSREGEA